MATAPPAQMPLLDDEAKKAAARAAAAATAAAAPAGAVAPPAEEYKPIEQPAEGLLQTAVGTPTQPRAPIDPTTYEDDDVVNQMNSITSQDSDYMKLARTSGLQTANKRGLLNSSIAAGASQAEALRAAAPLAMQNAQQMAARNQTRVQGYFEQKKQEAQFGHETAMQVADIENKLKMQGIDINADEAAQLRDFAARMEMQGIDIAAASDNLTRQLAANREQTQLQIDAEGERLGRTLTAQEQAQIRDIVSREGLAKMELDMKESQFGRELGSRETLAREAEAGAMERAELSESGATARANLDNATRIQLQEMNNLSEEQKTTLAAFIDLNRQYASSIDNLLANKDMPAPARDTYMQQMRDLRNQVMNFPALVYGRQTSWPAGAAPAETAAAATAAPAIGGPAATAAAGAGGEMPQLGGLAGWAQNVAANR